MKLPEGARAVGPMYPPLCTMTFFALEAKLLYPIWAVFRKVHAEDSDEEDEKLEERDQERAYVLYPFLH